MVKRENSGGPCVLGGAGGAVVLAASAKDENANFLNGKERKMAMQLGPDSTWNHPHLIKLQ